MLKTNIEQDELSKLEIEFNESLNPEIIHQIEDEVKKILEKGGDVEI